MRDTGAPWNIPYVAGTDLVRDWPTDSQDLAEAVADGLDAAGGLVAVKHALFTGTQQETNVSGGASFAVTDLSITHTLSNSSNKLIISAYFGLAASNDGRGHVGLAVAEDGTFIGVGDSAGSRLTIGAGGRTSANTSTEIIVMPSVLFVHEPGDTASHTYTVRAINIRGTTKDLYINRTQSDSNSNSVGRGSSALVIQEVKV